MNFKMDVRVDRMSWRKRTRKKRRASFFFTERKSQNGLQLIKSILSMCRGNTKIFSLQEADHYMYT